MKSDIGFEVLSFPVGSLQCNCSLIWDPKTNEAILVDPGDEAQKILKEISSRHLKIKAILHTHAHFDHVGASAACKTETQAPLYLHPGDKFLWDNLSMQGKLFGFPTKAAGDYDHEIEDELELSFGKFKIKSLHTPGHTPGSCSFLVNEFLFSGDTLFQGSIGRTDLWGGDFNQLSQSIKERLYVLDPDTLVIPGHGPQTQIGLERRENAFVTA